MAHLATDVDDRSVEQLWLPSQRPTHVGLVQREEPLSEHFADVGSPHLRRAPPEPLHVGGVRHRVAQVGVPVGDHRGQAVEDRAQLIACLDQLAGKRTAALAAAVRRIGRNRCRGVQRLVRLRHDLHIVASGPALNAARARDGAAALPHAPGPDRPGATTRSAPCSRCAPGADHSSHLLSGAVALVRPAMLGPVGPARIRAAADPRSVATRTAGDAQGTAVTLVGCEETPSLVSLRQPSGAVDGCMQYGEAFWGTERRTSTGRLARLSPRMYRP